MFLVMQKIICNALTNDEKLKKSASEQGLEVHGILWVFDQLILEEEITMPEATKKLKELMEINPWLPRKECYKKIKEWESYLL